MSRQTMGSGDELKIENAQLKAEHANSSDKLAKLQKELHKIETDKKEGINKIQVWYQSQINSIFSHGG